MIEIDGSYGEGGGQILRTSLSLAALTGRKVRIYNIRSGRRKPGLMRQHLTALNAIAAICGAGVCGDKVGSMEITLEPGKIRGGDYRFSVGTAGSTILIAQTILPVLLFAGEKSTVRLEGGTHADMAPIYEYFAEVFLPLLRRMGAEAECALDGCGFYPAGGGAVVLKITPCGEWKHLELMERGEALAHEIVSVSANIPEKIGEAEISQISWILKLPEAKTINRMEDSPGPGNVVYVKLSYANICEMVSICGEKNKARQTVAKQVAKGADEYLAGTAPVGPYLADQLLLPLALGAGGRYETFFISQHTATNIEVIKKFLDVSISVTPGTQSGQHIIEVIK